MSHCYQCQREVQKPANLIGSAVSRCICGALVLFLSAEGFKAEALNEIVGERAVIRGPEARLPENHHLHSDSGGSWVVQQAPVVPQAPTSGGSAPTPRPPLRPEVYASIVQQWYDAALEANWAAQRTLLNRR
jgi:hypothetical protein